jgi:hypothetical protein
MDPNRYFYFGMNYFLSDAVVPILPMPEVKSQICILSGPSAISDKINLDKEAKLFRKEVI